MSLPDVFQVLDCPACRDLHPIHFDEAAGVDGADVCYCPLVGRIELSTLPAVHLREVVAVNPAEGSE